MVALLLARPVVVKLRRVLTGAWRLGSTREDWVGIVF